MTLCLARPSISPETCVPRGSFHLARAAFDHRLDLQELTIVDLFHLPYGAMLPMQGYDFLESGKYPNVTRYVLQCTLRVHSRLLITRPLSRSWWKDISSRESWKKVKGL